jgi:pimeloyl-ACP methyl ester carboxylesterase
MLLHGLAGSWRIWRPVLPGLECAHRVIAPTLPGHRGGPSCDVARLSVGDLADALERRLDRIGLERVHLVGNSLGGWLALELTRRGRARSTVVFSPAGAWEPRDRVESLIRRAAAARRMAGHVRISRWPVVRRPLARRLLLLPAMERGDLMSAAEAADFLADSDGCSVFDLMADAFRRDGPFADTIAAGDVPITIAWGLRDRVIPFEPYGRLMLEAVPDARLRLLRGVGHVPMYDDPQLVVDTVLHVTGCTNPDGAIPEPLTASRSRRL